jgi:PiT family inorganic phosphate transporter
MVSVSLAGSLARRFSGKGLIPDSSLDASALTAIGLAGALTVLLATVVGMPTSTTHALTGALAGVGLSAAGSGLSRSARARTIIQILVTWVTTLPLGFLLGAGIYILLSG